MNDLQLSVIGISLSIALTDWKVASLERRIQMLETEDPEIIEKLQEKHKAAEGVRKFSTICAAALIGVCWYLRGRH
jgi:hypothetical protein